MYLSKVNVDPRYSAAAEAIRNPSYLHSIIQTKPFEAARKDHNVLYRIMDENDRKVLYVQSDIEPDWSTLSGRGFTLVGTKNIDAINNVIREGSRFVFSVLANPIKKVTDYEKQTKKKVFLENPAARLDWLTRYAERNGFRLLEVSENHMVSKDDVEKKAKNKFVIRGVEFNGVLEVKDAEAFKDCLRKGLGPEKAYGYGLMMLRKQVC